MGYQVIGHEASNYGQYPVVVSTWPFVEAIRASWRAMDNGFSIMDSVVEGFLTCEELKCDVGLSGSSDENGETTFNALVMDGISSIQVTHVINNKQPNEPTVLDKEQIFGMAEKEMEYRVELFNKLIHTCFNKCVEKKYKESGLNMGENSCIDRCVSKYWHVSIYLFHMILVLVYWITL
ncbi:hypothetical protein C1H46_008139 [Malus baccata]|uniref:Tim10-like domain-containing protein n=1 Tax=Malus baccata TaxID=106549 RepID=A0A540N736_MALBA|nr:hypothetical protein C1H46_008139 [Malus baccata]